MKYKIKINRLPVEDNGMGKEYADIIINNNTYQVSSDGYYVMDGQTLDGAIWHKILNVILPNKNKSWFYSEFNGFMKSGNKNINEYFNQFQSLNEFVIDGSIVNKLYDKWFKKYTKEENKRKREMKKKGIPTEYTMVSDRIKFDTTEINSNPTIKLNKLSIKPYRPIERAKRSVIK